MNDGHVIFIEWFNKDSEISAKTIFDEVRFTL